MTIIIIAKKNYQKNKKVIYIENKLFDNCQKKSKELVFNTNCHTKYIKIGQTSYSGLNK